MRDKNAIDKLSASSSSEQHRQEILSRQFKKLKHKMSYLNMEHEEISDIFQHAKQKFISAMFKYCRDNDKKSPFSEGKDTKKEAEDSPEEIKELYREIVKNTHPDKTQNLSEEEIESRAELYHEATDGKTSGDLHKILKVALELNIEIDSLSEELINTLESEIIKVESHISKMQKDIMYRWYYADPDQQKKIFQQIAG